jgi:hypothetical protein
VVVVGGGGGGTGTGGGGGGGGGAGAGDDEIVALYDLAKPMRSARGLYSPTRDITINYSKP